MKETQFTGDIMTGLVKTVKALIEMVNAHEVKIKQLQMEVAGLSGPIVAMAQESGMSLDDFERHMDTAMDQNGETDEPIREIVFRLIDPDNIPDDPPDDVAAVVMGAIARERGETH